MVKEGGGSEEGGVMVEWRWSGGGGPSHLLYRDTEEVGGLDTGSGGGGVKVEWWWWALPPPLQRYRGGGWAWHQVLLPCCFRVDECRKVKVWPGVASGHCAKRWPCFLSNERSPVFSLEVRRRGWWHSWTGGSMSNVSMMCSPLCDYLWASAWPSGLSGPLWASWPLCVAFIFIIFIIFISVGKTPLMSHLSP